MFIGVFFSISLFLCISISHLRKNRVSFFSAFLSLFLGIIFFLSFAERLSADTRPWSRQSHSAYKSMFYYDENNWRENLSLQPHHDKHPIVEVVPCPQECGTMVPRGDLQEQVTRQRVNASVAESLEQNGRCFEVSINWKGKATKKNQDNSVRNFLLPCGLATPSGLKCRQNILVLFVYFKRHKNENKIELYPTKPPIVINLRFMINLVVRALQIILVFMNTQKCSFIEKLILK